MLVATATPPAPADLGLADGAEPEASGDAGAAAEPEKKKKPANAVKREKDRLAAQLRRKQQKLKAAKSLDELKALEDAPAAPPEGTGGAAAATPTVEVLEPGQLPGWPAPSAIEAQKPLAQLLVSRASLLLGPTRYGLCLQPQAAEVEVVDGEQKVKAWVDPKPQLANALAPLIAQNMAKASAMTPAAAAFATAASIFGPTAVGHLVEVLRGLFKKKPRPAPSGPASGGEPLR